MRVYAYIACWLLFAGNGFAFPGRVTQVTDGDSIRVVSQEDVGIIEDSLGNEHDIQSGTAWNIRLQAIDAPETRYLNADDQWVEHAQAYGPEAQQTLQRLIGNKIVEVRIVSNKGKASATYNRLVGQVILGAEDVGLSQVRKGLAWVLTRFLEGNSYAKDYERAEFTARESKLGLWQDPNAISPSEWRKNMKSQKKE